MTTEPADQGIAITQGYLAALTRLLLGHDRILPGLALVAGRPLDTVTALKASAIAAKTGRDLIYAGFVETGRGLCMTSIDLILPRAALCNIYVGCELWLGCGETRAVLLPRGAVPGTFAVLADEVVHLRCKPGEAVIGIRRADRRLRALVKAGCDVTDQIVFHSMPRAA